MDKNFTQRFILKLPFVTGAELELAGRAVVLIMGDGNTVVETQWTQDAGCLTARQDPSHR